MPEESKTMSKMPYPWESYRHDKQIGKDEFWQLFRILFVAFQSLSDLLEKTKMSFNEDPLFSQIIHEFVK